jgi:hypothetical protein
MIAAVKGWHAVLSALLLFLPRGANAADDLNQATRELARQTAALAGKGEPVAVEWRNASSLGAMGLAQARGAFEAALREAGGRIAEDAPPAEAQITLSENPTQFLLVEEARKGDDHHVWIAAWKRATAAPAAPAVTLQRKLLWEQDEPVLDAAFPEDAMLVLSPSGVSLYVQKNGHWEPGGAVPLTPPKPWPRNLRGRLRRTGMAFQAFLPGMTCDGTAQPALAMKCRADNKPWVLDSGRYLMLGSFAAERNYFDGRVVTQTGEPKTVAPFFSAAAAEEQGRQIWALAMVDGTVRILDAELNPLGDFTGWGSDIVGVEGTCGGGFQVLATRPGDGQADAVQPFAIVNRAPFAMGPAVNFAGPVTALWPAAGGALAVTRNPATGKYQAYAITAACGR